VTPAQGATNVAINTNITATFSVAMNPASITASSFTLAGPGGAPVTGTVTYSGGTATFMPSALLAYGTTYTATIGNGAKTPGGTGMLGSFTWSFTTVNPGIPYVASVTPIQGAANVDIAAPITATFSQAMGSASISGATFTLAAPGGVAVTGTVTLDSTNLIATFVPTGGTLAFNTTYTATITTGAMSTFGIPLAGDYVWSFTTITPPPVVVGTVPANNATGVPVTQVLRARFNEPMLCSTLSSPATTFTLVTGGVQTPVAGTVACSGREVTFTPNVDLAFNSGYTATISTGAQDLAGTAMAAPYTWLFVTVPAPPIAPVVISTVPANLAVGVPVGQALTATFSEAMDPASINSATFLLSVTGGAPINGVISYAANGSVATFTPNAPLAYSTNYTATITSAALDLNDDMGATSHTWTFTTAATPLAIPPTVVSTVPVTLPMDTSVPLNQLISADFSKAMNPNTITSTTFMLTGPGTTPVSGLVVYAAIGNQLLFIPTVNLTANTTYTATITTGVQDLAGDPLAANYVWTFQTSAVINPISPEIVATVPASGASNVPLNQAVSATFSEAMNGLSLNNATFQLTQGGNIVPATITYDAVNFIATLTPTNPLTASTTYIATVTNGATDLALNPLGTTGAPNPWTFTTGAAVVPAPIVLGPTIALFGGFGGGAGMTNQGISTVVNGDIGTTGASSTMTGFYDETVMLGGVPQCNYSAGVGADYGLVNGTIETATPPPTVGCPSEGTAATALIANQAALEAQTAYTTLQNIPPGITLPTNELGNLTLAPGVYTSSSFYDITAGPLTLDAQNDPNAFWVFQMGSYLTVGTPTTSESVVLINGAQASNVFWQVGGLPGAVINYGGGGTMVGTIISSPGITVSSPGVAAVTTINGRVIALHASTTMVNTVINVP